MNIGAFAGGLATGIATGQRLANDRNREKREEEAFKLDKENKELDIGRKRDDENARKAIESAGRDAFRRSMGLDEPQPQEGGEGLQPVSNKNPFGERGAMIDGAEAMAAAAIRSGKLDLARHHLEGASGLRTQLRSELAEDAYQKLKTTGDASALATVYNKLWPDGGKMDPSSFQVGTDEKGGKVYKVEFDQGGKRVPKTFTEDQLAQHVAMLANPKESLSADLQLSRARALQQWKWDNDPDAGIKRDTLSETKRHNQQLEGLKGQEIEALRDYRRATLSLRGDTAARRGQLTPKDVNTLIDKGGLGFRKLIESEQSKEDAKMNPNAMMSLLPAMQSELGVQIRSGTDPELAFEKTYYRFKDLVGSVNDSLGNALQDAGKAWGRDAQTARLQKNLTTIMEEKGLSRDDLVKFVSATRLGASNPLVRQAIANLPQARSIGGTPGLEPKPAPAAPAAVAPTPERGRARADQFFN